MPGLLSLPRQETSLAFRSPHRQVSLSPSPALAVQVEPINICS